MPDLYEDSLDVSDTDLVGDFIGIVDVAPDANGDPVLLASCDILQRSNTCPPTPDPVPVTNP